MAESKRMTVAEYLEIAKLVAHRFKVKKPSSPADKQRPQHSSSGSASPKL